MTTATINPFYTARLGHNPARVEHSTAPTHDAPRAPARYARLPRAPVNASPVPWLTSLYHNDEPGPYGDRRYPGNCPGNLIKDVLGFFAPARVLDPFSGSGTCADVCCELEIPCTALDIRYGQDACNPASFPRTTRFPLIWAHPPYWRMKRYTLDPRDLSNAATLDEFLDRYARLIANCAAVLEPNGILAVLVGDYHDREAGFAPLTYHTKRLAFAAGLVPCGTDIIRFSHGASSGKKVYRSSFIPGLHDTLCLFRKPAQAPVPA